MRRRRGRASPDREMVDQFSTTPPPTDASGCGCDGFETTAFLLSGLATNAGRAARSPRILRDHAPVVDELIAAIRACPTQEGVAKLDSALAARSAQLLR
jgi:hypothetical protein